MTINTITAPAEDFNERSNKPLADAAAEYFREDTKHAEKSIDSELAGMVLTEELQQAIATRDESKNPVAMEKEANKYFEAQSNANGLRGVNLDNARRHYLTNQEAYQQMAINEARQAGHDLTLREDHAKHN